MRRPLSLVLGGAVSLSAGTVEAAPRLLVTELDAGEVTEFTDGGDLSVVEPFAWGLGGPTGMCVGPGGHLYVAEAGGADHGGQITIITEGGDFTDAPAFAESGLGFTSLWCNQDVIYVGILGGMVGQAVVMDATDGGQVLQTGTFEGIALFLAGDLERDSAGTLLATDLFNIFELGDPLDVTMAEPFATGRSVLPLAFRGSTLLAGDYDVAEIVDATEGGDLSLAPVFATLPPVGRIQGLLDAADEGLYAMAGDEIFLVPPEGGDLVDAQPVAWGLQTGQLGYQQMLRWVCSTDEDCADADACNGTERCVNNECLPPEGPTECDDADVCTVDSCDSELGCANDVVDGCCTSDVQCTVDEVCDTATNACVGVVPIPPGEDGADDTGGSSDGGEADSDGGPGEPAGSTGLPDAGSGGDDLGATEEPGPGGCVCTADAPDSTPGWGLFVLLGPLLGRRRSARDLPRAQPHCRTNRASVSP
ncbi:MAG: hypothetical protein AAF721_14040 [Myxococcota bacterium]